MVHAHPHSNMQNDLCIHHGNLNNVMIFIPPFLRKKQKKKRRRKWELQFPFKLCLPTVLCDLRHLLFPPVCMLLQRKQNFKQRHLLMVLSRLPFWTNRILFGIPSTNWYSATYLKYRQSCQILWCAEISSFYIRKENSCSLHPKKLTWMLKATLAIFFNTTRWFMLK